MTTTTILNAWKHGRTTPRHTWGTADTLNAANIIQSARDWDHALDIARHFDAACKREALAAARARQAERRAARGGQR